MKCLLLITAFVITLSNSGIAQETKKPGSEALLSELAENGCRCVDSINVYNKSKGEVVQEISRCINDQAGAFQMGTKLMGIDNLIENAENVEGKKQVDISLNVDENSEEYKMYYYELERYMMDNCASLKIKIAADDKQSAKSITENKAAFEFYSKGIEASEGGNSKKAVKYYKKALKEDPEFAFAWDNLGLSYRRLNDFDKAIESYGKSLEIDPYGVMPLQNIAVAYLYKKEYSNAIDAYERLAEIDANNPEVYYGIGNVYASHLKDYVKGLEYMCKAYVIYVEQQSPYRTDAEKVIGTIYSEMKKQGKEEEFNEILKAHNISQN